MLSLYFTVYPSSRHNIDTVQMVKSPVLSSRPVASTVAAPEAGLVESQGHGNVMTSQPAQEGVKEHREWPVPGGAEEGLRSSQVYLVGQDKSDSSTGPRRSTGVRTQTDRYGHSS